MNHTIQTQQIYGGARCTDLTVESLRSKGASKRGHIGTINLIQFHIQRQLNSLNADPGIRKAKQARIWLPPYNIYHTSVNTSKPTDRYLDQLCSFYSISCLKCLHVTKPSEMQNTVVRTEVIWNGLNHTYLQVCFHTVLNNLKWSSLEATAFLSAGFLHMHHILSPLPKPKYLVPCWSWFHIINASGLCLL